MNWITIILLITAGLLSVSSYVVSRKPDYKEFFDKLVPYAGGVGVALLIIGLINFFGIGSRTIAWWDTFDLFGLLNLVAALTLFLASPVAILLGFMQGYALIDKYVLNRAKESGGSAGEKFDKAGDKAYEKIVKLSTPIGFVGIAVGLLLLLFELEIISPV